MNKIILRGNVGQDPQITDFQNGGKVAQWLGYPIAHHPFPLFCFRMKEEERKRMFAIGSFLYAQVETGLYVRFQVMGHYFSI